MERVFISYSRKDIEFVRRLADSLQQAGYDVWWDISDLQGGDNWVRTIEEAVRSSRYVLVVLSPHAVASDWVRKEYSFTLGLRKKIVPVMLQQCDIPLALTDINYVDFTGPDYLANVRKLLEAFNKLHAAGTTVAIPAGARAFRMPRNIFITACVGAGIILIGVLAYLIFPPTPPVLTPTSGTPTMTAPGDGATTEPSPTPSPLPTTPTPTRLTPTRTRLPQGIEYCVNVRSIFVRSGPGTTFGAVGTLTFKDCPLFDGRTDDNLWIHIAPGQGDYEFDSDGWVRADLVRPSDFDQLSILVFTPSDTPTFTPTSAATFTPTNTSTPTPTNTPTPKPSPTVAPTEAPESSPTVEITGTP
jgi:hypothetical protein